MFTDWFEPGFKAGGPIRSCVNFARHMKDTHQVYVFTSDRDLGSESGYPGIETDRWITFEERILVYYCSPQALTWQNIKHQCLQIRPDFLYLNSMYSLHFTIYPLLITQTKRKKLSARVILAPRGMLKESALYYKRNKKKVFLSLFFLAGFHRKVIFHATDPKEVADVKKLFGAKTRIAEAGNFPGYVEKYRGDLLKQKGLLKVVFIGRLHPIKNLDFLLKLLPSVNGKVVLTVVGGEEDKQYAQICRNIARDLKRDITVKFAGEIPNKEIRSVLDDHHLFALPTNGENFGHAIFEALAAGKPVLISDQTPWKDLQSKKAGWDLPLQAPELFTRAMQQAVDFTQEDFNDWSWHAWKYVDEQAKNNNLQSAYQKLFN